jgi:DNA-binding SARP family transcriptional activator/tetratricopeptide (TPR) repeat protein
MAHGRESVTASESNPDGDSRRDRTPLALKLGGNASAVVRDGAESVPLARLDAALLGFLALEGVTPRQRLLHLLWPDQPPEAARNALRQRLFRLRRAIGAEIVEGGERLSLVAGVTLDLGDAGGELLASHDYADRPAFDAWLGLQRSSLHERQRQRIEAQIDALERDGRHAEAASLAARAVADDVLDEAALQRLMKLLYLAGQRGAAISAFERFEAAATAERTGPPARSTLDLLKLIRSGQNALAPTRRSIPASVLRPPRLVGRGAELQRLHGAWAGGRVFWLLGEAGLGKTRLIAEALFTAREADVVVNAVEALAVSARPGDAGVPYASLGRVLRALVERQPGVLERAQRGELARVLPEIDAGARAGIGPGQPLMLQRALEALLHEAHARGLAVLVIDDLHFADSASLEMLSALVLADALAGLRWGFAQRPAEGVAAVEALRVTLEEAHRIEALALRPLDEAQMAELIASLDIDGLDAAKLAAPLVRHTGGNPLFALETIKHLILEGQDRLDTGLPRPASVGQLIERRMRQLSAGALALARVAAIAGVDFSIELAEQVLGIRALALADAWHELEAAQVLRQHAFAHDLVHEATLAGVPQPIAAHTHGAVAAFLESHEGEAARVAAHWIAAGQAQRALAALHAAAHAARRAMRRKEQAGFLAQAAQIESGMQSAAAFDSLREMVEALWVSDRVSLTEAIYDRLEAHAGTAQQRGVALTLRGAWAHNERNDIEGAKRLCRQAITLADEAGDEATGVQARQRLAEVLHYSGEFDDAVALLQQLHPWFAEHAGPEDKLNFYGDLAIALDNADRSQEARAYHQRAIDIGRQIGAWSDVVIVQGNLAISWATGGYMARAITLLQEALKLAAAHDEARGCGASLPIEIHNALRDCGRYADAQRWIEPAMAAAEGQLAAWRPLVQCQIACHWIHLGQHARAQREIEAALATTAPDWMRAKALQMQARMRTSLGRPANAVLVQAHALMPRDGRRYLWASIALDHALSLEPGAALEVARHVIALGERLDTPAMALAGHIRAMHFAVAAGQGAEALIHARAGLAFDDEIVPNDLYTAERWLNAWRALRFAGRTDEAREVLHRGATWVRTTLDTHVPEPFRDSFIRANPVNQQLMRDAAQVAADAP